MKARLILKLPPGPCGFCGKRIRIQKLWCSIKCQNAWEQEIKELENDERETYS